MIFSKAGLLRRHANFRRLWAAQSLSAFGSRITRTAIPVIAINSLDSGAQEVAWLSAAGWLPFVVAGMFASGFIERAAKRRLMIGMDIARLVVVLLVPVLAYFGGATMPVLVLVSIVAGFATAIFQNADGTLFPQLIGSQELVEGNAAIQTSESLAEIAGPGFAGMLIDLITAPFAMIVDALTFLWSAIWLSRISHEEVRPASPPARKNPWAELRADLVVGWRAVWNAAPVRATFLSQCIFYIAAGGTFTLYMLLALRTLALSPGMTGFIIGFGGIGALAGTFLAPRLERRMGLGSALVTGLALNVAGLLFVLGAALGLRPATALLIGQQLVGDCGGMIFMILATSLRQQLVKGEELARANGLFQIMIGAAMPLFGVLAGIAADQIGIRATFIIGTGAGLLSIVPCLTPALLKVRSAAP